MRAGEIFRVWAPSAVQVALHLRQEAGETRVLPMTSGAGGWFEADGVSARAGDRYGFALDGASTVLPDPRALAQPDGVHALSAVAPALGEAQRPAWSGKDLRGAVTYELHVGTFAADPALGVAGTFDSAIGRLDHLVALGVDAVEVMPVAAFPGERGWGYDGVGLFAVHEAYGGPEAFARFIDAAHERGLSVILDVVYNHLGPSGNYLGHYSPYFTDTHTTPWGPAVNLDAEGSEEVRAFIFDNARQWLVDFGVDGLRIDAVHALRDDSEQRGGQHLLAELADRVATWSSESGRPLTLIAESDLNDPLMVTPSSEGGRGMGAQWADDIHHALHSWITGETSGYYVDFGSAATLQKTLTSMFEHDGTYSTFRGKDWGKAVDLDGGLYDAHSFVTFLQNHDQVGNRAAGDRIHHAITPDQHAAAAALYLLGAASPMLFMGEEWAASSPFPFFSDHDAELGPLVTAGRTEEFARMGWSDPVPDPQARSTFTSAFLPWDERDRQPHADILAWYTRLLQLRREYPDLRSPRGADIEVTILGEDAVVMRRGQCGVLAARSGVHTLEGVRTDAVLAHWGEAGEADGSGLRLTGAGAAVFRSAAASEDGTGREEEASGGGPGAVGRERPKA
ncbi:MAG: malto-oligosyltrehalose trehalohydrolase [Dermabacter sp.]|nr:malto-oligosyltrehalose trehalohydrolase [Dermabacter sp.]